MSPGIPDATEAQKARIRELGEQLDAHRKARQAAHPKLTITDMYNVLERLRELDRAGASGVAGQPALPPPSPTLPHKGGGGNAEAANPRQAGGYMGLTDKERLIHEQGLVSVLRQIHDDLDQAVAEAYGWPADLTDEQILERLVALNKERAAEEERGLIRWLRPEFQNPAGAGAAQANLAIEAPDEPDAGKPGRRGASKSGIPTQSVGTREKIAWPATLAEQAAAVRSALAARTAPAGADDIAAGFKRAKRERIAELLETLASLGQARKLDDDRYAAA